MNLLRIPLLLAIAVLGLGACKEEGDTLSKRADASQNSGSGSTSDSSGSSSNSDGSSTSDGSTTDNGGNTTSDGSTTDNSGGTTDNSGSGTDGSGGNIGNEGAPMTADDELVGVSSIDSTGVTQSLLTIVRSNGEIWEFEIPGIPTTRIGTTLTYRNVGHVFGAVSGEIIFEDGSTSQINTSRRIQ
ncbi:MAG: hypothetical protein ACREKL_09660 [Chthoniobacterales bacterium]